VKSGRNDVEHGNMAGIKKVVRVLVAQEGGRGDTKTWPISRGAEGDGMILQKHVGRV